MPLHSECHFKLRFSASFFSPSWKVAPAVDKDTHLFCFNTQDFKKNPADSAEPSDDENDPPIPTKKWKAQERGPPTTQKHPLTESFSISPAPNHRPFLSSLMTQSRMENPKTLEDCHELACHLQEAATSAELSQKAAESDPTSIH